MNAPPPVAPATPPEAKPERFVRWHHRILAFCLIVFAFELGLFLLVFPWLSNWDLNWIPVHSPRLFHIWMSRYFRGAISGLGLLNIYIALAEFVKQVKMFFGVESK
ncbi:MAG: hypothetical protein JO097_05990 [Acidobacteriaceae bacterium]|nr:hypothetical protein [Acidobacteriaceae bacterium]